MSMSEYATYAEYQASLDKSATLTRLQSMNAELEAEAQMKRDAERYRYLRDGGHIVAATIGSDAIALPYYKPENAHKIELDRHIDAAIARRSKSEQ